MHQDHRNGAVIALLWAGVSRVHDAQQLRLLDWLRFNWHG
ncbi:MAG: hypothetical protein IPJ25_04080 [Rhodocyclaceae bacterium]|nr:hypothetical protein [Rhodocyclaceae bacterium]